MALRRIHPGQRPLIHVTRPFSSSSSSSSNPPFPPPPSQPPSSDDPNNGSSRSPSGPGGPNPGEGSSPAASSLFLDIRERLRSSPAPPPPRRIPMTPPRPTGHGAAPSLSLDDVKRTLESFRVGSRGTGGTSSSAPRSSAGAGGATPSFQDLLRNSAAPTGPPQAGPNAGGAKSFSFAFDNIRESLRKLGPQQQQQQQQQQRPTRSPFLSSIPQSVFGRELLEKAGKGAAGKEEEDSGVVLARDYSYEELGKRLGELRPAGAGKDGKEWFSLEELQGRIAKLAELEKKQEDPRFGGQYDMLRSSLKNIKAHDDRKNIKSIQGMSLFANIGGKPMPEYMLQRLPPQEELLERYFHPDHMSSEEKMKLELQKVRDEFKMSENDCGSARVQIAQLTLKIKHLSSVLHKKDKHSRKGLQDMVQRRKKYLKYLRRTDWDSYCLVLSKLGLRDVPEYKAPDYTKTQPASKGKSKKSKSKRKRKMKA